MVDEGHYYSRSFALLKSQPGWIKPLLVMGAASLVPVVGALGCLGYAAEYARLTAWGVDAAPKQRGVRVGECIKAGGRSFVASLGCIALIGCLTLGIRLLLGNLVDGALASLVEAAVEFVAGALVIACMVHAAVYQSYKAGYSMGHISDMAVGNFAGILRISLMRLVMGLIFGVVLGVAFMGIFASVAASFFASNPMLAYSDTLEALTGTQVLQLGVSLIYAFKSHALAIGALIYLTSVLSCFVDLISFNAVALWMRGFNVRSWGRASEPLPREALL